MFMTPGKSLAPWLLLLEQESYLPYTKTVIKDLYIYIYIYICMCIIRTSCAQVHELPQTIDPFHF